MCGHLLRHGLILVVFHCSTCAPPGSLRCPSVCFLNASTVAKLREAKARLNCGRPDWLRCLLPRRHAVVPRDAIAPLAFNLVMGGLGCGKVHFTRGKCQHVKKLIVFSHIPTGKCSFPGPQPLLTRKLHLHKAHGVPWDGIPPPPKPSQSASAIAAQAAAEEGRWQILWTKFNVNRWLGAHDMFAFSFTF